MLNDLFGIQARGGCSCAGPYGHRLLAIDPARSHAFRDEIGHGCEGIKPGWTRINFNYFISDTVAGYLIDAVRPDRSRRLPAAGRLPLRPAHRPVAPPRRHPAAAAAPERPALRPGRHPECPRRRSRASEAALDGYLREARDLLAALPEHIDDGATGLPADFEALRWFHLPPAA